MLPGLSMRSPIAVASLLLLAGGCLEPGSTDGERTKAAPGPGGLPETIRTDYGTMNVEKEYLPGVVDCELGWYTTEAPALQAQAIAARTYLARHLTANGDGANVPIGPTFQCWRSGKSSPPLPRGTSGASRGRSGAGHRV